jgi:benzodiazapine receptor
MEKYLPVGVTLLTILANALVNFSGESIKEISNKYNIKYKITITPAPFTFSIWGVIYSLLLYVTFTYHKDILTIKTPFGSIFTLFVISSILNALWLYTWGKSLEISSIILIMLASILMLITVELNKTNVDKILIYTFGIYTAWVIVATLFNLSTLLSSKNLVNNNIIKYIIVGILTLLPFLIKHIFKNILDKSILPMLLVFIWGSFGTIMNGNNNLIFLVPILSAIINVFI